MLDTTLAAYDQVWFYGVLQCNLLPSQPDNELTGPEVAALRGWMDAGGGVLITGDHANPKPSGADPALDPLLNLGRALGRNVPRAGQLRKWEGLPDASFTDNHNTMVPTPALPNLNDPGQPQQSDDVPQQLILTHHALPSWHPYVLRRLRPHPLFCGRAGVIKVFPDHMHEGLPLTPSSFGPEWPTGASGIRPLPRIEARGTDKRNGQVYPVTIAYDGDDGHVGRIVADATWHHYFNVNLQGFTSGAPGFVPSGSADQKAIANYYQNLAVWLAPKSKRQAMRCTIWWWLLTHPELIEVARSPYWVLGGTAYDVLGRCASQCTITELIWVDFPKQLIYDRELPHPPIPWPPEEIVLAAVLTEYQEAMQFADTGHLIRDRHVLQAQGWKRAMAYHTQMMESASKDVESANHALERVLREMESGR